jgi:hypothetical protein
LYLVGTQDYALVYNAKGCKDIIAHTDSDWASDPQNRRSQTSYYMKLAGGSICWKSCAQKTIAHSFTETKYMALLDCSKQCLWLINLISELGLPSVAPIQIYGDNQDTIFNAQNPVTEGRTKHIDIRYHAIWQYVDDGLIDIGFIPGMDNPADLFTKNLL